MRFWLIRKLLSPKERFEIALALRSHHQWLIQQWNILNEDPYSPTLRVNRRVKNDYKKQEDLTHSLLVELEKS